MPCVLVHTRMLRIEHGTNPRTVQKDPWLTPSSATPLCGFAVLVYLHDTSGTRCNNLFLHFMHLSLSYFFFPHCKREHMFLSVCINEPVMPLLNVAGGGNLSVILFMITHSIIHFSFKEDLLIS